MSRALLQGHAARLTPQFRKTWLKVIQTLTKRYTDADNNKPIFLLDVARFTVIFIARDQSTYVHPFRILHTKKVERPFLDLNVHRKSQMGKNQNPESYFLVSEYMSAISEDMLVPLSKSLNLNSECLSCRMFDRSTRRNTTLRWCFNQRFLKVGRNFLHLELSLQAMENDVRIDSSQTSEDIPSLVLLSSKFSPPPQPRGELLRPLEHPLASHGELKLPPTPLSEQTALLSEQTALPSEQTLSKTPFRGTFLHNSHSTSNLPNSNPQVRTRSEPYLIHDPCFPIFPELSLFDHPSHLPDLFDFSSYACQSREKFWHTVSDGLPSIPPLTEQELSELSQYLI